MQWNSRLPLFHISRVSSWVIMTVILTTASYFLGELIGS